MKILGIETSCDETSVSIVEDGCDVHSLVIASQASMHAKTGGIVPEVAAREHVKVMTPCVDTALKEANLGWEEIAGIAVTKGPGLIGSLLVGLNAAKVLSYVYKKPIIGVNHVAGHIYANWLSSRKSKAESKKSFHTKRKITFPVLVLTISGGHNEIILMENHMNFKLIGESQDDAAGEAFDKVARILDLGFPGGPAIAKAALEGDPKAIDFPRAWLQNTQRGQRPREIKNFDFSFSGLKTAVLRAVETRPGVSTSDMAASFQEAVVDVLTAKLIAAAEKYQVKEIHLAGGVSANKALRERVATEAGRVRVVETPLVRWPAEMVYCTDNAAMIAAAGYYAFQQGWKDDWKRLEVEPGLRLKIKD